MLNILRAYSSNLTASDKIEWRCLLLVSPKYLQIFSHGGVTRTFVPLVLPSCLPPNRTFPYFNNYFNFDALSDEWDDNVDKNGRVIWLKFAWSIARNWTCLIRAIHTRKRRADRERRQLRRVNIVWINASEIRNRIFGIFLLLPRKTLGEGSPK